MPSSKKLRLICIGTLTTTIIVFAAYFLLFYHRGSSTSAVIVEEIVSTDNGIHVRLVHPESPEKGFIFLLTDSMDSTSTGQLATQIAGLSYYVMVVDVRELNEGMSTGPTQCLDIAERLRVIQKRVLQKFNLTSDTLPILVGIGEGGTLVYAALAQTDAHNFHAAISINLNDHVQNLQKFCASEKFVRFNKDGNSNFTPVEHVSSTWFLFQNRQIISNVASRSFTDQIANAKLTIQKEKNTSETSDVMQILGWLDPRIEDQLTSDSNTGGLPIVAVTSKSNNTSQYLAIMLTGDGGWAAIDKGIANALAKQGIPTIALDSLAFFWKPRTPEESAAAVESLMVRYLKTWHKSSVILIGYSFGADVLPFIANRVSVENRNSIALIALLGIGKTAAFEFHLSSWMDADNSAGRLAVLPEVKKMSWANSICIYGVSDSDANCLPLKEAGVKAIPMAGDHHFDEEYHAIAQHIIDNIAVR